MRELSLALNLSRSTYSFRAFIVNTIPDLNRITELIPWLSLLHVCFDIAAIV